MKYIYFNSFDSNLNGQLISRKKILNSNCFEDMVEIWEKE